MSESKWRPALGTGTCSHVLIDGRPCGSPATIVNAEHTVYLCALHTDYADPAVMAARKRYLETQKTVKG